MAQITFRKHLEATAKENITKAERETMMDTWAKDGFDDFIAQVAVEDSVMHGNLICSQGDADYNSIYNSLPTTRLTSIFKAGSFYVRNETNIGRCTNNQKRNKVACEAEGTCSDTQYNNNEAGCTGASGTWTSAGNSWTVDGKYFMIRGGVIYNFGTQIKQLNLAMHQVVKRAAVKALTYHNSLSPTSSRADQITKLTSETDKDTKTFAADANATYVSGDLEDPIDLNKAYQPRAAELAV